MPIETVYKGSKPNQTRWYKRTETGEEQPGVSAIVDMMPKKALTPWAARLAAEFVVGHMGEVSDMLSERDGERKAIAWIKGASSRYSEKAAKEGTMVHHYTEMVARAVKENEKPQADRVPSEMFPYLKNYVRFLKEFDVEPVLIETVVWDEKIGYAGRLDMACRLRAIDDALCIVDTKSGASGVWESVSLQQTAYRYADYMWDEERDVFVPMPEVARTYGLWLRPEGFALIPVASTQAELDQVRRLRESFEWQHVRAKKVIEPAINKNPIKRQRKW